MKDESQQQVPPGIVALAHKTLQPSPTRFTEHPDYDIWVTNSFRQNYFVHTISVDGKEYSVGDETNKGKITGFEYRDKEWLIYVSEGSSITKSIGVMQPCMLSKLPPETGIEKFERQQKELIEEQANGIYRAKLAAPPSQQDRSVSQPGKEEMPFVLGNKKGTVYFIEDTKKQYGMWLCLGEAGDSRDNFQSQTESQWTNDPDFAMAFKTKDFATDWLNKYWAYPGYIVTEHEFVDMSQQNANPQPSQPGEGRMTPKVAKQFFDAIDKMPLPEQGKEEEPDWKGAFLSMQDAFILTHKELTALKSRPSEGWSDTQLKDFAEYCDNHEGSMENLLKQWKNKQV